MSESFSQSYTVCYTYSLRLTHDMSFDLKTRLTLSKAFNQVVASLDSISLVTLRSLRG